jgi:hypothetical protein
MRRSYHASSTMSNEKQPLPLCFFAADAYCFRRFSTDERNQPFPLSLPSTYDPPARPQQRDPLKRKQVWTSAKWLKR